MIAVNKHCTMGMKNDITATCIMKIAIHLIGIISQSLKSCGGNGLRITLSLHRHQFHYHLLKPGVQRNGSGGGGNVGKDL